MSGDRHAQVGAIFSKARRLPDGERTAFIELACSGDARLREEVESLLTEDTSASGFLDTQRLRNKLGEIAAESVTAGAPMPERVGPFRVLGVIGEGGMGTVYEAQQDEPSRRVALKVIRGGLVSRGLLQRFRYEAQVLGQLRHPGIAQIYQAGTAESGQPYFAMELVAGRPILEHARDHGLGTRACLELVAKVCDALHHAHQKGIVHRDLKPANVLVEEGTEAPRREGTKGDDVGQPKVLDFGVARVTDSDVQTVTVQTDVGQLVGTVPYMSPEQAGGDASQVDIRSDVYSLGVIAYEMLTGRLPYAIDGKMIHEAMRVIREVDPSRLSSIDRTLRGDVETIVAKALSKEKDRRYQSAAELATDIRRYLADEPIAARPASALYQLRKFTRRNRALVAGAAAGIAIAFTALTGATIYSLRQAHIAETARESESAQKVAALRQAYRATLAASAAALEAGDALAARQQLDGVPAEQRGWEWRYLDARLDGATALIEPHEPAIAAALTPEGERVVTLSRSGGVTWWNVATGEPLRSETLAIDGPAGVAVISGDAATAAVAHGRDGSRVSVWSLGDGPARPRASYDLPERPGHLACSSHGRWLAALTSEHELVWDTTAPGAEPLVRKSPPTQNGIDVTDDGDLTAAAGGTPGMFLLLLHAHDSSRPNVSGRHPRDYQAVALSRDGALVATGGLDKLVRIRDATTTAVLHELPGHGDRINALAFSPDARTLASGGDDATLRLWDVASGSSLSVRTGHEVRIDDIAFSADGRWLVTRASDGVRVWESAPDRSSAILAEHDSYVYCVAYSPDGLRLYTGGWDYAVRMHDAAGGGQIARITTPGPVTSMAIAPDGRTIAIGSSAQVILASTRHMEPRRHLAGHRSEVAALAFSPDGTRLLSCTSARQVFVWDVATGKRLHALEGASRRELGAAFSPDGRRFAAPSPDGTAVYDTATAQRITTLDMPLPACAVAWSRDGASIATGGADALVRLYDAATGALRHELAGHASTVYSVAFSPDGTRLASGSNDTTIRIWDPESGTDVGRLRGHHDYVFGLAFSPDGRTLASASGDFTVRTWDTFPWRIRASARFGWRRLLDEVRPVVSAYVRRFREVNAVVDAIEADPELDGRRREAAYAIAADRSWIGDLGLDGPPPGRALEFHGGDDHVLVGDADVFRFDRSFTFEAWVQPFDDLPAGLRYLVNKEGEYQIALGGDGALVFTTASGPGWPTWRSMDYRVVPGEWTHVALVHEPDGVRACVNGVSVAILTQPGPIGDFHPNENELRIGNRQRGGLSFRGLIREVRLWNVGRSAEAIKASMSSPLSGDEPGLVGYWPLDDGEGPIARDATGRHDGRLNGVSWHAGAPVSP